MLNAKPEFAQRIKAVVHMDMVGGGPETKAVFHVTRGPMSLPSFVDVAWAFAAWLNEESYEFAATGAAAYPLIAPDGGREPLRAMYSSYSMGSDHDVYQDSSFAIPAIYLNDWPDRYIHTNLDSAANIDTTKLKRAAFIGAASGYFLANYSASDQAAAQNAVALGKLMRAVTSMEHQTPPERQQVRTNGAQFAGRIQFGCSGESPAPPIGREGRGRRHLSPAQGAARSHGGVRLRLFRRPREVGGTSNAQTPQLRGFLGVRRRMRYEGVNYRRP